MKSTITPAQVTTVEDKIAGNMTFIQILFLIIPLITATVIYVIFPPKLQLGIIKLSLMVLQFAIFAPLAIRIKGKTLADWLVIILRFKLRPRIYVFTKNDIANREMIEVKQEEKQTIKEVIDEEVKIIESISFKDQTRIEELLKHPGVAVTLNKKGGINVALKAEE